MPRKKEIKQRPFLIINYVVCGRTPGHFPPYSFWKYWYNYINHHLNGAPNGLPLPFPNDFYLRCPPGTHYFWFYDQGKDIRVSFPASLNNDIPTPYDNHLHEKQNFTSAVH